MPDLPEIKFSSIRAHLGSQTKGFEELVTQIFRLDTQNQGTYCRVEGAGGDGGVEAYVVRPDSSKIGVQSKFFEKVKATQWKQIEKSVHAALANHPELTEYRIAVPIDRNKTQIDTWNAKVFSWNRHAASLGITNPVKFVWQGNSDLIGELIKPACAQAQSYWFGTEQFSADWMDRVFQLALKNLDRRYSPAEHVHTEAGRELQAFAHSPIVAEQLKRQFLQVLNAWNELQATVSKSAFEFNRFQLDKLNEAAAAFKGMSWPERSLPSLRDAALAATAMREAWLPIHVAVENESEKAREAQPRTIFSGYRQGPHDDLLHYSGKLFRQVDDWHRLTTKFRSADFNRVLVSGDAGNGKSHVLAAIVAEARERGQPALLLLGEQFTEQTPLAAQIATATDWD